MEQPEKQRTDIRTEAIAGVTTFFTMAYFIVADPVTYVKLGTLDAKSLLTLLGLGVTIWLLKRNSSLAFLSGIILVTLIAWLTGFVKAPEKFLSAPDFSSVFFKL